MSQQTIPIVLTPIPVPTGTQAATWDELLDVVCKYVQGQISANVSFFLQGTSAPVSNQGVFFNLTNNRFEVWNASTGKYIAITDFVVGDMKVTFVDQDDTANGWVVMNGRLLTAVSGLTQVQLSNLQVLFGSGTGSSLPNYSFISGLATLPDPGTFSSIATALTAWTPAVGTVKGLVVNNPPAQADVQGIQNALEQADDSGTGVQAALVEALNAMETVLDALNGTNTGGASGPVWVVFCGLP